MISKKTYVGMIKIGLMTDTEIKMFKTYLNDCTGAILQFKYNDFFILPNTKPYILTNFLAYPIIIKENKFFNRKKLQIFLEKNYIQTRPIFSGNILRQPAFSKLISKRNRLSFLKNADYIQENSFLIGNHHGIADEQRKFIVDVITNYIISKTSS